jgi:hypothetical protein
MVIGSLFPISVKGVIRGLRWGTGPKGAKQSWTHGNSCYHAQAPEGPLISSSGAQEVAGEGAQEGRGS